jgi:MFS family permease
MALLATDDHGHVDAYAVAFLAALLCLGRLSDHVGRRVFILAGIKSVSLRQR